MLHINFSIFYACFPRFCYFSNSFCNFSLCISGDKTPAGFPVITQGPGTRVIEVGHTVQMQCKAIGNPTPNIYWIKNQTKVDMTNPRYVINNGEFNRRETIFENDKMKSGKSKKFYILI